jgi:endoglucanase
MRRSIFLFLFTVLSLQTAFSQTTIVQKYGKLQAKGSYIIGQYGDTVQLRGMSLFWSQWKGAFYNPNGIQWLRDDWKCTVVRAAMGVEHGGYLDNKIQEEEKVTRVVKAAINNGIYVIIDYHSHDAHNNPEPAVEFFSKMAEKYGRYPNVIYEIYNEPLKDISWPDDIKPYAEKVVAAIREKDGDNLIICGTRCWSQYVGEASLDPVKDTNIAYTLHFYAASHGQSLRDQAERAMKNGVALFVTEYGTCEYTGNGKLDSTATREWWNFLDKYKISWCNWAVSDKEETASALILGAGWGGRWKEKKISPSGRLVRNELILKNGPVFRELQEPQK